MIALLLLASALAAPAAAELRAWSDTAVELRPDAWGKSGLRAVERLGLRAAVSERWSVHADGGLRLRRSPYDAPHLDVYRFGLAHHGRWLDVELGRHVRLDPRGLQRVDGASARRGAGNSVEVEAWAGRLWHPALWSTGTTAVGGAQLTLRPVVDGRASPLTRLTAGAEGRLSADGLRPRAFVAAATATPTGHVASALFEAQPGPDPGARAHLRSGLPAGRSLDLGAELRWEDLRPATAPVQAATPFDWLSDRGYAVGSLRASWRAGAVALAGHAGPTVRRDGALGGIGRLGLSWSRQRMRAGLFATAAGLDGASLAGGGGGLGLATGRLSADADVGAYRYRGLDGGTASIWEGRVEARLPVYEAATGELRRRVELAAQGAAGTDRQLAAWVRGGLALHAELGRGR